MDEKLRELLDSALRERFELACQAMKEENPTDGATVSELVRLSEVLEHHPGIREDARKIMQEFLSLDSSNNANCRKCLYIQGAKDCVAVLRELDLIKRTNRGG